MVEEGDAVFGLDQLDARRTESAIDIARGALLLARGDQVIGLDNLNEYYDPASPSALITPDCLILGGIAPTFGPNAFPKNAKRNPQQQ